ncbi:Spo0B domain-containing protein [Viridibacillus arvi]|uniref:Spo0B domain-containing protein n=1 Tax=Viridibacillus arvi TaxID=263475 RepID=UPI0036E49798
MTEKPLTVNEVLRFAHHDFLNQLQLIKINLDMGRVEESKEVISGVAEQCRIFFNINQLGLPKTIEWFHTLKWRYPSYQVTIQSNVDSEVDIALDGPIKDHLERTISYVYSSLNPYIEQNLSLHINSTQEQLEISFHLKGSWDIEPFKEKIEHQSIMIKNNHFTNEDWCYCIEASKEGI